MKLLLAAAVAALFLPIATLRADEASHRSAADSFLTSMDFAKVMSDSIEQMLQIQMQQNPQIAKFEPQMRAFFKKYMSWESMKDEMAVIYMAEFTEAELKELTAFYKTPIGKKAVEKMPVLMAKGAEVGQKKVQEHMPELQAAIQAAMAEKK